MAKRCGRQAQRGVGSTALVLLILAIAGTCQGMGMVQYGPVKGGGQGSFAQPGWPSGIMGTLMTILGAISRRTTACSSMPFESWAVTSATCAFST